MDAGYEGEQSGVAAQVIAKLIECPKAFLRLGDKSGIRLKGAESKRIVDMLNTDTMLTENFS